MIQKIQAYKSSDGTAHSTLEEAQNHELFPIIAEALELAELRFPEMGVPVSQASKRIADYLMKKSDKIVDILTMRPNSLPKARRINGGTKKRTPKHIAEQHTLPLNDPPKEAA